MRRTPFCLTSFLTFERNSITGRDGVSSIYIGAFARRLSWISSCSHSQFSSFTPPLILSALNLVSETIIRFTSWIAGISREKKATGILWSTAAFLARLSTKAVFPTEGRAARMIRSDACHPRVILSTEANPEGTPLSPEVF